MVTKKALGLTITGILFSSSTAFAVVTTGRHDVFIPQTQAGPEISISALALKAGASNLNYIILNNELPAQSPSWYEQELKPNYEGAFRLQGRYVFLEGKDVSLNWTHLNSSTTDSIAAPNEDYFLGPDYEIGPDAIPNRNASGKAQFNYNLVNLEAGQSINVGRYVQMRFFGGLSYGSLGERVTSTVSGDILDGAFPGPFSMRQKVTSDFYGVGPRFGLGATLVGENGFGLLGEFAASALIGNSHAKTEFFGMSQELIALFDQEQNYQTIKDENVTQVIPGFEAKVGVNYNHAFQNGTYLTLEAGWQAAVYINAVSQYTPNSLVGDTDVTALDTGGIFVATMDHRLSNYSVQGPFLTATLRF